MAPRPDLAAKDQHNQLEIAATRFSHEAPLPFPDSQGSSFNDSLPSQSSEPPPRSSEYPEPPRTISAHRTITPSTSLSNNSSQEKSEVYESPRTDTGLAIDGTSDTSGSQPDEISDPVITYHQPHRDHTTAPKRMINGEIKSESAKGSLPTSPTFSTHYGHSRNSSMTSRISQMGELSSQLRTRLSYAMVKVQNGWQGHSINELEYMTSHQDSPASAASEQKMAYEALNTNASPTSPSGPTELPTHLTSIATPEYAYPFPHKKTATTAYGRSHQELNNPTDSTQPNQPNQPNRTYESFWREHSGSANPNPSHFQEVPSLGPPVDILPRNSWPPESAKRQPPPLHTTNLQPPSTPPPKPLSKMRTPSQQAAVEKDAVETLLFMSSPGNTGYHPPTLPLGTPLRRSQVVTSHEVSPKMGGPGFPSAGGLSERDIDKMLDEMPDSDSSSSEDEGHFDQRGSNVQTQI